MSTAQNAVTAEAGNSSATIHARVGDSAIDKVTRLFSAGLADIFTETLQTHAAAAPTALPRPSSRMAMAPALPSPTMARA